MSAATITEMSVTTSEAHVLAVARRFGLSAWVVGDYLTVRRQLGHGEEIVYRARITRNEWAA